MEIFHDICHSALHSPPPVLVALFSIHFLPHIFLYFGEANVYLKDLDSFLAIAEEIQLKGWTGQSTSTELVKEQESNSLFSDERLSVIGRSFIWEKQNNEKG